MESQILIFVAVVIGVAGQYQTCEKPSGTLNSVDVQECTPDARCYLKKGTDKSITISFTPSEDVDRVKVNLFGVIQSADVPYARFDTDGCVKLPCPLKAGQTYAYNNTFHINQIFPNIAIPVKWSIRDMQRRTIICFLIDAEIVNEIPAV